MNKRINVRKTILLSKVICSMKISKEFIKKILFIDIQSNEENVFFKLKFEFF